MPWLLTRCPDSLAKSAQSEFSLALRKVAQEIISPLHGEPEGWQDNNVYVGQPDSSLNIHNRHIDDRNRVMGLNIGGPRRTGVSGKSNKTVGERLEHQAL